MCVMIEVMNSFKFNSIRNHVTFDSVDAIELDSLEADVNECDFKNIEEAAACPAVEKGIVDVCGSGLQVIPESVLQAKDNVKEISAGHNILREIGLSALVELKSLRILRLQSNGFTGFPVPLLNLAQLTVLDLSDNLIESIPLDIYRLKSLEELWIDRNCLSDVPSTIRKIQNLHTLLLSHNRISKLSVFSAKMRTLGLVGTYDQNADFGEENNNNDQSNFLNPPLTKVSLRANKLRGSIILGNYGYLNQLDVSENDIEILDLSALDQLESLQCSRNKIREITLNGRVLRSLIAGNNELTKLSIFPVPTALRHLDVSFNKLKSVPDWIAECDQLQNLFASNNAIESLPAQLFHNEKSTLYRIQLEFNSLRCLPPMPNRTVPLQELFVQNNKISDLPDNLFLACKNLVLLNVSSNNLLTLPTIDGYESNLEKLYVTCNYLTDRALDTLKSLVRLRILQAAYNQIKTLPDVCATFWPDLEELILSGNSLQHLPDSLADMQNLRILRVHSNQLQTVPALARTKTLRVLDLAHNRLDKINLATLVSMKLTFLDLSCNNHLQVDPKHLQSCQSQRLMSLVDVSGKNRESLPTASDLHQEYSNYEPPWKIGFSETSGKSSKLYISQLRLPMFCNNEGLFGIFDGEASRMLPVKLVAAIPKILLVERTVKETAIDYMKYTILSAHKELKQDGQRHGVSAILCHISLNTEQPSMRPYHSGTAVRRRYVLRVASVGQSAGMLIRKSGYLQLALATPNRSIGNTAQFPHSLPDPEICEILLTDQDEYLVVANKTLWEVMNSSTITKEIRMEQNVLLAAKRIQDIAQSYGAEENLSLIIVKFNNLGTDGDYLMRELRHTIGQKPVAGSGFGKCGCCCENNNHFCHSGGNAMQFVRHSSGRSDRSSPSGQSDHTASEVSMGQLKKINDATSLTSQRSTMAIDRKSMRSGVVRAVRARIEEEKEHEDESDSTLSEEQFKCWEYMLEQNTQLLFDKELNTISKAFTKKTNASANRSLQLKPLSVSTPQLSFNEHSPKPVVAQYHGSTPFLSRQFGSARSFHPQSPGLLKSLRFGSDRIAHPIGGPNAAYFGSLQRLMPYNLEYDFAVMAERMPPEDSLEYDQIVQQYWGVATTEL